MMKQIELLNSNQTYEQIVVIFSIYGKYEVNKTIGFDRIERKRPLRLYFILFFIVLMFNMSSLLLRLCTSRTHLHVTFMAFIHKNLNNQCVIYSPCNRTRPSSRLDPAHVTGSTNLSSVSVKSHNFDRSQSHCPLAKQNKEQKPTDRVVLLNSPTILEILL